MSAYAEYATDFADLDCLIEALLEMKNANGTQFTREMLEVHQDAQKMLGYQGDVRSQKANVLIRGAGGPKKGLGANNVGGASNDIGWEKNADGKYVAHISEYDSGHYNETWQSKLAQTYAEKFVEKRAKRAGFKVEKEKVDGRIRMKLSRWR